MARKLESLILEIVSAKGKATISELVEETGYTRSWVWKTARRLEREGLVKLVKHRGVLTVEPAHSDRLPPVLKIGILRAAEYPYIIPFAKYLSKALNVKVDIHVYDDPFILSMLLARGVVRLAMIPAVSALVAHRMSKGSVYIIGGGSGGGAYILRGTSGDSVATTMASSMELCTVLSGLEGPRIYASSGEEIVSLVSSGRAKYGVVWEPYASIAKRRGIKTEQCDLPACCVLSSHKSMLPVADKIRRIFAESVSIARRRLDSPALQGAYSRLVGLPVSIVKEAFLGYTFYEEPPISFIRRTLQYIRETVLPETVVRGAVIE